MKELDRRLRALPEPDTDRDLSGLEAAVWAKISARSLMAAMPRRIAAGLCAAAAALALTFGAAAGMANAAPKPGVFAVHAPLAPSTILN